MTYKKRSKQVLLLAGAMASFALLTDAKAAKAAKRFATGGVVTSFHYVTNGVGYTAFVHTFTNTAEAAEFRNRSGKTLPVRLLAVGGGGAGMEGMKSTSSARRPGGGGGGGGGVTETNTFLSADDVWTICVGAGGTISSRGQDEARGEAGTSSVSNGVVEVVSVPGGGAGGSRETYPTVGAAGGGGSGSGSEYAAGAKGNYTNSVGGVLYGPYMGGWGGTVLATSYGGGGGGAGADGAGATGGEGLTNDISGVSVVYGSGGGGGGHSRVDRGVRRNGGNGGTNAGNGGNCEWDIVDDGATTNIVVTKASAPIANTGAGGAGGVSFGGGANSSDYGGEYAYATEGADGVVIIRYDIPDTPCVGGDVVTVTTNGNKVVYVHTFTNTSEAATFTPSVAFDGTSVRMLVVGGGGAGMDGIKNASVSAARYGGGGGGGGGVTETNAFLSVGDVWTIRVGAGGGIPASHSCRAARYEAGASSVSNGVMELVLTPGGGAGGSMSVYATEGAAGGGGSRYEKDATCLPGANGTYGSFTFKVLDGIPVGPFKGGDSANSSSHGAAGGGGGAGEEGGAANGGEGLVSDITGADVTYGSGGGGGGMFRVYPHATKQGATSGGNGGDGAGNAGECDLKFEDGGSKTNLYFTSATAPALNRGGGGAGGASFNNQGDDVYVDGEFVERTSMTIHYATPGADGVVIIRYEVDLPHPKGFMVIVK